MQLRRSTPRCLPPRLRLAGGLAPLFRELTRLHADRDPWQLLCASKFRASHRLLWYGHSHRRLDMHDRALAIHASGIIRVVKALGGLATI